jgi:hypothetical protein
MRPIDELAADICSLAGRINAANHRWLLLIGEFDRRKGWSDGLTQSCAHWLNWKCGVAMGAAREKVRVAHALENLPKISAAMESGWRDMPQGTLVNRWRGERMNYGLAIDVMIQRARRAKDVPAGTSDSR